MLETKGLNQDLNGHYGYVWESSPLGETGIVPIRDHV